MSPYLFLFAAALTIQENQPAPEPLARGTLELVKVEAKAANTYATATMKLSRNDRGGFYVYGYSIENLFYQLERKQDGKWTAHALGWCGTGAGMRELKEATTTFSVHLPDKTKTWRVSVRVYDRVPVKDGRSGQLLWSAPVTLR